MKVCDLTQFYSPVSGGVKRYVSERLRFIHNHTQAHEHVLIVPGERDGVVHSPQSRAYTIESPLISRRSGYRVLLRLEAIERILELERPDIIECGDPYQVAWKALASGRNLAIPVVAFYHSHFPEAYLRGAGRFLGPTVTGGLMTLSQLYVRKLYNGFARTIVPSPALGAVLRDWGVDNVVHSDLGVDASVFHPDPTNDPHIRTELGIPPDRTLLLYVGRLAQEKNTHTLFEAFAQLILRAPDRFHLLVVGDGLQRTGLEALRTASTAGPAPVSWIPYCPEPGRLAQLYRSADLFVHPGLQETFGLVTLEAQACGLPVVGIQGSYMDRIVLRPQTHWARENSPEALATAIDAQSANIPDPDPGQLHDQIAARYSWQAVFGKLFALYEQVLQEQ